MGTISLAKKSLLSLIIVVCALLFALMNLVNNMERPISRHLTNLIYEQQYSKTRHRSNTKNTFSDTLNNLPNNEKVFDQKPGFLENKEKFNDKQLSISQQGRQSERSPVLNGSHLLHVSGRDTFPPLNKASHLIHAQNISSTSQQEGHEIKDDKESRFKTNVLLLAYTLEKKLSSVNVSLNMNNFRPTCESDFKLANSCDNNKCLQTDLPMNVTARVEQLVTPRELQMSAEQHEVLHQMADQVTGNYDIILLTASSSNHFLESQALLKNLHENVYPHLKNFTLVFYNLGLTEQERTLLVKYCKCQVMDFPFHKFPQFMNTLQCYAWKPILIKAHLQRSNLVFWVDASIRFHNSSTNLQQLIHTARERGIQISGSKAPSVFRTHRSMYHFFGDEPCAHFGFSQSKSGLGVYHREYFVDRVILEPWVACSLNENCMCLEPKTSINCEPSFKMDAKYHQGKGPIVYGLCHRFDQSAISLILQKLYQDLYAWVTFRDQSVMKISRDHTFAYFERLMRNN